MVSLHGDQKVQLTPTNSAQVIQSAIAININQQKHHPEHLEPYLSN